MKVTVCFGNVRVVVPCGNGEIVIQELIDKAITRYKKAIGKPLDYWVCVHQLKSLSDGGILDPDDLLNDVADDREQIIAQYEEQDVPPVPHNGGDGTSASSVGTASPDMFTGLPSDKAFISRRQGGKNDVVITENDLNTGSNLIVRRGSEPALTTIGTSPQNDRAQDVPLTNLKRWSAIASIDESKSSPRDSEESNTEEEIPVPIRTGGIGQEQWSAFTRFARDSTRQSLASNSSSLQRWIDAQERQEEKYNDNNKIHVSRKEPLGGSGKAENDSREAEENKKNELQDRLRCREDSGNVIALKNTGGPLGIHVVPDYDENGRDMGLVIQGIEAGGRIYRDGRLAVHDRITEINGTPLFDVDFTKAQDVFKQALQTDEISLRVVKNKNNFTSTSQLKPSISGKPSPTRKKPGLTITVSPAKPEAELEPGSKSDERKIAQVQPTKNEDDNGASGKKVPPAVPVRHPSTALSSPTKTKFVAPTNTRRIGKKIHIELTKGADGLGFSVTTRDNPAGGNCPIYIKNILPKGAAVRDGNLKSGDRLLEVNDVEMTGKSQSEAVSILRNTKPGSTVKLVVSRQVLEAEPVTPQDVSNSIVKAGSVDQGVSETSSEALTAEAVTQLSNTERLTYDIPLNDCGSAGLGVSVKGKTTTTENGPHDLGIFIKSVISGGAASKDGRLKINDQLLEVNDEPLTGMSNSQAMDHLRTAMQKDAPKPGFIHLVVGRRKGTSSEPKAPQASRETRISNSEPPAEEEQSDIPLVSGPQRRVNALKDNATDVLNDSCSSPSAERPKTLGISKARNPVLDRLTGINNNNFRNESYQRATHDSLNESTDSASSDKLAPTAHSLLPNNNGMTISSPSSNRGETVLIEGDNYQVQMHDLDDEVKASGSMYNKELAYKYGGFICNHQRQGHSPKIRPASTLGFSRPGGPDALSLPTSRSSDDLEESGAPKPPAWLFEADQKIPGSPNATDAELSPRDEDGNVFSREGFGRRSMSEKRRAHLDPRSSEFYQKLKQTKDQYCSATWDRRKTKQKAKMDEEQGGKYGASSGPLRRAGSAESLLSHSNLQSPMHESKSGVVGPTLGLKKSSSLESLQTAVQEAVMDDEGHSWRSHILNRGAVRGRGCNDSFRAAVDRSYEGVMEAEAMETLEEESSEYGSDLPSQSLTESTRSSFSGVDNVGKGGAAAPDDARKNKKKEKKDLKEKEWKDKDKGGLFKGLGHMFRFGRHRKQGEKGPGLGADLQKPRDADLRRQEEMMIAQKHARDEHNRRLRQLQILLIQEQQERINEQYRKLQEKEHMIEIAHNRIRDDQVRVISHTRASSADTTSQQPSLLLDTSSSSQGNTFASSPSSRTERIQQLRAEHQRRHRERQGQYPLDAQEEAYERQLQEYEKQRALVNNGAYQDTYQIPPRMQLENEHYDRPPSRLAYSPDPAHYTHYQNYHEIQAQLNHHHDHYQRIYHHQHYGSNPDRHMVLAHQLTAPELRQRAVTPDPSSSAAHHHRASDLLHHHLHHDLRSYPRSHSSSDARQWVAAPHPPPQQHQQASSQKLIQAAAVVRPHTPQGGQLPYMHQHPSSKAPVAMLPPQILVNAPHEHYRREYSGSSLYDDPRKATYSSSTDPNYGSLQRRRDRHNQSGILSGPAQV